MIVRDVCRLKRPTIKIIPTRLVGKEFESIDRHRDTKKGIGSRKALSKFRIQSFERENRYLNGAIFCRNHSSLRLDVEKKKGIDEY